MMQRASGEAQLHIFQQEAIYISSKKDIHHKVILVDFYSVSYFWDWIGFL
jgi:hypothetical protein